MLEAGFWALLGQASLILGALLAIWFAVPKRLLGLITGFGAGTILTMLAAVMMPTAYEDGREAVGLSFVLGFAVLAYLASVSS